MKFLDRDLNNDEIKVCEKAALEYVRNDAYEIELHNLNEVNEYFRIFKDEILKKEHRYQSEVRDLKTQLAHLKSKLENGLSFGERRLTFDKGPCSDYYVHNFKQPFSYQHA